MVAHPASGMANFKGAATAACSSRQVRKISKDARCDVTDREMLMMVYGALRAIKSAPQDLLRQLEEHLFPGKEKK